MDLRNYFTAKPKQTKAGAVAAEEKPKVEPEKKRTSGRKKTIIPDSDDEEEEKAVEVKSKHFSSATPAKKEPVEEPVDPKAFFASAKTKKSQSTGSISEPASSSKAVPAKANKLEQVKETKETKEPSNAAPAPKPAASAAKRLKKSHDNDYFEDDSDAEVIPPPKARADPSPAKAKPAPSPKKATPASKTSNSKKRKGGDDDDDDDDAYKEEEEDTKPAKKPRVSSKKVVDDGAMDVDESTEGKPKKFNYWEHKNKAGPSALGSKEIPQGRPNCFAGLTFVFTGELSSITREDASDLVKRYSGRVTGSPSGKTSYVVVGGDAGQSKLEKVKKLKIKTVDEDEFLELIRDLPERTEAGEIVKTSSKSTASSSSNGTSNGASKSKDHVKVTSESEEVSVPVPSSSSSSTSSSAAAVASSAAPSSAATSAASARAKSSESAKASLVDDDKPAESELWTTKYRPAKVQDLCGNNAAIQRLSRWLEEWDANYKLNFKQDNADKSGTFRAVLISGPPGIGKTSAAHLVGNSLGYNIVEFNASDTRSKKSLDNDVRDLLDNQSLAGYFQAEVNVTGKGKAVVDEVDPTMSRKQLIVMDEVDGMAGGDRGGVAQLISFIKKTHVPIICICNDRQSPKVRSLVNSCFDMRFTRPTVNQVRARLMSVLHREGRRIPANVLDKLVTGSQSDIRQVLNMLSTWSLTKKEMDYDEGTALSKASEKYVALNPFQIAEQLLVETNYRALSVPAKFDMYFNDYQLAPLMIQENYIRMNPTDARGDPSGLEAMELISKAADSLSDADLVDTMIHGSAQHWSLMPTHAAFSCVRPSFFVHGSMRPGSGGNYGPMMQFPSYLGQFSKSAKYHRIVKDLQIRMRLKISGDKNEVRQSYLPALFPALTKPLVKDGVEAIPELIEFMDSYYLSKEDWDSVLELGIGRNDGKKVMDSIPTATKSAFTRKYNSEAHPQPFLKATVATKGRGSSSGGGSEETPDNDDVVEADAPVPEDVDEAAEAAEEESIEKDSNIKQKKARGGASASKASKGKGKGKAPARARK